MNVGDHVRYRPGPDVYGYEDMVEADGTLPAIVLKFTDSGRVRLKVSSSLTRRTVERVVHLKSLEARSVMTSKEMPKNENAQGVHDDPKTNGGHDAEGRQEDAHTREKGVGG